MSLVKILMKLYTSPFFSNVTFVSLSLCTLHTRTKVLALILYKSNLKPYKSRLNHVFHWCI